VVISSGGGTRIPDTRMMIPSAMCKFPEKHAPSQARAAPDAAEESGTLIDADLRAIIERWAELPDPVKAGILAMVRAVRTEVLRGELRRRRQREQRH